MADARRDDAVRCPLICAGCFTLSSTGELCRLATPQRAVTPLIHRDHRRVYAYRQLRTFDAWARAAARRAVLPPASVTPEAAHGVRGGTPPGIGATMSGHEMRQAEGVPVEQQTCSRCNMSHQQFVENGRPRCPGRPYTNADLWPDIRVKPPRADDLEWMQWAKHFTQQGHAEELQADLNKSMRTRERLRSWAP